MTKSETNLKSEIQAGPVWSAMAERSGDTALGTPANTPKAAWRFASRRTSKEMFAARVCFAVCSPKSFPPCPQ
jgi:hypothetical protein